MEARFPNGLTIKFELNGANLIGRGATAEVFFAVVGDKRFAAKIYRPSTDFDLDKIEAMCRTGDPSKMPIFTFAWPQALVHDNGKVVGYLMPLFDRAKHYPLNYYFDSTLESKLQDKTVKSLSNRVEIANSLCSAIATLHDRTIFFIDLKPQNILVNSASNGVILLDCDGYAIRGSDGKFFPAGHISTDYIAPEVTKEHLLPTSLGEYQDNYALAVILFQIFNYSQHPFQGTPVVTSDRPFTNDELAAEGLYPYSLSPNPRIQPRKGSTHIFLPKDMRLLFDRSFVGERAARVTPREWNSFFSMLISEKRLQRCSRFPTFVSHIHFRDEGCPECAREEQKAQLAATKAATVRPPSTIYVPPSAPNNPPPINPPLPKKSSSSWKWIIGICVFFAIIYASNSKPTRQTVAPKTSAPVSQSTSNTVAPVTNPRDLTEVDRSTILPGKLRLEFQRSGTSNFGTLSVFLPSGSSIVGIKNPALFLSVNDCVPSAAEIMKAQSALSSAGYRLGIVDGIMGPATIKAVRSFQAAHSLDVTGDLDPPTASKLGVYVGAYDATSFKFHSRGTAFDSVSGPIINFLNVPDTAKCFFVTRK